VVRDYLTTEQENKTMFAYNAGGVQDRSGEIIGAGSAQAAQINAQMLAQFGQDMGGVMTTFAEGYNKKKDAKALDKAMGMAADEGLITYDTLEKFTNLPWQEKAPVFSLWRESMLPVQTNRMKVQDQARIWGEYRGAGGGSGPASSANNKYGYVYQGP
jgi:hypothetical protein